jgi:hypothetical protein
MARTLSHFYLHTFQKINFLSLNTFGLMIHAEQFDKYQYKILCHWNSFDEVCNEIREEFVDWIRR